MTREEVQQLLSLTKVPKRGRVLETNFRKLLDAFMLVQNQRDRILLADDEPGGERACTFYDSKVRALLTQPNLEQGRE